MTPSREPERPQRAGRKGGDKSAAKRRRTPILQRFSAMLEGRRDATRSKRERTRRERAAIQREKAAARREKAKLLPEREPRKPAAGERPRKPAVGERSPKPAGKRRPEPERKRPRGPARKRGVAAATGAGSGAGKRARRARSAAADRAKRARSRARPAARTAAAGITSFGERASKIIRGAMAPVGAAIVAVAGLGRNGLGWLAGAVTPLRAAVAVTGIAAVLLAVSQFVDYRGVAVGVDDYAAYADVEPVAPAPQVDRREAGEAHSYLLVPLGALALVLLVASVRGRWQLGRVVSLLGLAALAVALLVDVPAGLDEGEQAIAYASVEAHLLEGFYVEVVSAAVLVAGGLLVAHYARPAKRRRERTSGRATVRRLGARTA